MSQPTRDELQRIAQRSMAERRIAQRRMVQRSMVQRRIAQQSSAVRVEALPAPATSYAPYWEVEGGSILACCSACRAWTSGCLRVPWFNPTRHVPRLADPELLYHEAIELSARSGRHVSVSEAAMRKGGEYKSVVFR